MKKSLIALAVLASTGAAMASLPSPFTAALMPPWALATRVLAVIRKCFPAVPWA